MRGIICIEVIRIMVQEALQIEKIEGNDYILTFDVSQFSDDIDGHVWAMLIKSHMKNRAIELEGVDHDPESNFYCATASSIEPLKKVASVIQILASDRNLREIATASFVESKYHDEDDMSTGEWLEMLEESGIDMDKHRKASFFFSTFQDENLAKRIEEELNNNDYKTEIDLFDGDFIVEAKTTMKPKLNEINRIEEELKSMALDCGAIYINCEI